MKKVILDRERCFGCGMCCSHASENFTFDDDGRATLINENVTNEAIEMSEMCPASAITIENNECSNECNCGCQEHKECKCDENCTCSEKCNCDSECTCGCQEGKTCTCEDNKECTCEECSCNK